MAKKKKTKKKVSTKQKKPTKRPSNRSKLKLFVPTNSREKLVDLHLMKPQAYLSETTPTLTRIKKMHRLQGRQYEVENTPCAVSTTLKLVLKIHQTKELSESWSLILWNINQKDILPEGASVTFVRSFERRDSEWTKKTIKRRRRLAILSSDSGENIQKQTASVSHDLNLLRAINTGDSVVGFSAEVFITAPNELILEEAVSAISDYLAANDETRGLHYSMDINRLAQPLVTYGPNKQSGNKDVMYEMTSYDAAQTALFVDSGGDRTLGAEYVGVSVGKLIRSHAAYNFQNHRALFVGNDTNNQTYTIAGIKKEPSQVYLSKVASRSYLLNQHSVTHIVCDHADTADQLMSFPLHANHKVRVDVSKGLLNIMEPIRTQEVIRRPERVLSHFPMHINSIIALLSQFREKAVISMTDTFADIARDITTSFFITNKYWVHNASELTDLSELRFFGRHDQYKMLRDFGSYVAQRLKVNHEKRLQQALEELDMIINRTILPTIPALNTQTDPIIDTLMDTPYRVVDLTGMGASTKLTDDNPSMNIMMLAYLNVLLPALKNGDLVVIHGFSQMKKIAPVILNILSSSGSNLNVLFTESNQTAATQCLDLLSEDGQFNMDFLMIDLYDNQVDTLTKRTALDADWSDSLKQSKGAFFVRTRSGLDYIYLDDVL